MKKTYKFTTRSAEGTERVGALLAEALDAFGICRAFIAMRGEMGVGKTAFVRGFAGYFGIKSVKSPTYTILNEYRGKTDIFHFDMYRVETEDDLISIGYDDCIFREGFTVCEWSENIEEFLPGELITVTVSRVTSDTESREIEISLFGFDFYLKEGEM